MDKHLPSSVTSILLEAFPTKAILPQDLHALDSNNNQRVEDEIKISGIEGLTWIEISSSQARGTLDVLGMLAPDLIPTILPGYLQWLWDREEADIMSLALPKFVLSLLGRYPHLFDLSQLLSISRFISTALDHTQHSLSEEEAASYLEVVQMVDGLVEQPSSMSIGTTT